MCLFLETMNENRRVPFHYLRTSFIAPHGDFCARAQCVEFSYAKRAPAKLGMKGTDVYFKYLSPYGAECWQRYFPDTGERINEYRQIEKLMNEQEDFKNKDISTTAQQET